MGKNVRTAIVEGRRLPVGVRLVRVLVICGIRVPVVRASADNVPELTAEEGEVNDGFWCSERTTIFLREGQSPSQERDSLVHEAGHAFLQLSGLQHLLRAALKPGVAYDELEETFVRVATPNLVSLMTANKKGR